MKHTNFVFIKGFLLLLLSLAMLFKLDVFAQSSSDDSVLIEITTEKTDYRKDESIIATMKLANTSSQPIVDIVMDIYAPEGYSFEEGNGYLEVNYLDAGDQTQLVTVLVPEKYDDDDENATPLETQDADNIPKGEKTVNTGDEFESVLWLGYLLLGFSGIVLVILLRSKDYKASGKVVCLLLAIALGLECTVITSAEEIDGIKYINTFESITVNGTQMTIECRASYHFEYEFDVIDPDAEKIEQLLEEEKIGHIEIDLSEEDSIATKASVDYVLENGTGYVDIFNISSYSFLSEAAGAISGAVDLLAVNDTVSSAELSFDYDPERLGEHDPNNFMIMWYDEENEKLLPVENTVINTEANTVSAELEHFSSYVLVDVTEWYEAWSKEQMVIRNDDPETETPYYNVVLTLDNSGSMDKNINILKSATYSFIHLLNENDMFSIVTYESVANIVRKHQRCGDMDDQELIDLLNSINASGGTNFESALFTALSLVVENRELEENAEEVIARQSMIVFLSDGNPTEVYTEDTLDWLKYLQETVGCRCITIGLGDSVRDEYMQELADTGNGTYRKISNPEELEALFEEINGWYIGSNKDSDADGLPDIVETTGMRNQFGKIYRTDPYSSDTDGDGITDKEEMGKFVLEDSGKSYFIMNSSPDRPTAIEDGSRVIVKSTNWSLELPFDLRQVSKMTFQQISDIFKTYKYSFLLNAAKMYIAKDYLTETLYTQDAVANIKVNSNHDCGNPINEKQMELL